MAVRAPLRSAARPTAGAASPANSPALRARPMTPTDVPSPAAITPRNGAGKRSSRFDEKRPPISSGR